jgi:3-dehydroquinate synthase
VSTVVVRHALGEYPVYIESGALGTLAERVETHLGGRTVALVTDSNVGRLYEEWESGATGRWRGNERRAAEMAPYNWVTRLAIAPGDGTKTRATWTELTDALLERGMGRQSGIVALGGGMVGDLGGFVAATYMRGIPFIQVPTTVVAMVDASVGGKVGVNVAQGKNLIGAFHPPVAVVADPFTLRSLPEREYRAGLAEAVKHGLIADAGYFEWMEREVSAILARDLDAMTRLVQGSVEIKARIVEADERESGRRATLNAGHTVGHALEHLSRYSLPHGEAVGLGLVAECSAAERAGIAEPGTCERVTALLERFGLPIRLESPVIPERFLALTGADKKNRNATIRCALPSGIGRMPEQGGEWTVAVGGRELVGALEVIS